MKNSPKLPKNWAVSANAPALKPRSRNNRGSSIGCGMRSSHATKNTRASAEATNAATVRGSPQPRTGPSMMPNTRPTTVTRAAAEPSGSRRAASASREPGTTSAVPTSARTARATLRPKNEFQA